MRTPHDARRWCDQGTELFLASVDYDGDSALPGWSRRQLIAHVAANAQALGNLVRWAATGVPTPMYESPGAREAGIERGSTMVPDELDRWLRRTATDLSSSMRQLDDAHWAAEVVTAQGRAVPATEIPWLRAREVFVHAVDLDCGVRFADLPVDFLEALRVDVITKRGEVPDVDGPLAERVAWLTGRRHGLADAPHLGAWL